MVKFEWDARKARENIRNHGITFEEALTVFADWEQITIPDHEHSIGEDRRWACPVVGIYSLSLIQNAASTSESSARGVQIPSSESNMKTKSGSAKKSQNVLDYDFSNGVRGKYAARYAAGTNVVVLSPEMAEVFPDSEAVNEALKTLVRISGKRVGVRSSRKKRAD